MRHYSILEYARFRWFKVALALAALAALAYLWHEPPLKPYGGTWLGYTLGTISAEVAKSPIERTALIIVGKVLGARDFRNSALYDAAYQRRFRGRGT